MKLQKQKQNLDSIAAILENSKLLDFSIITNYFAKAFSSFIKVVISLNKILQIIWNGSNIILNLTFLKYFKFNNIIYIVSKLNRD